MKAKAQDGIDFFFKMKDSYAMKGSVLDHRLVKTGLQRREIAQLIVDDPSNKLNTVDSALNAIRGLINENDSYNEALSNSIKKIVGE